MVLKVLAVAWSYFPSEYTYHIVAAIVLVLAARGISQGRVTTRERDLHARVILLTGAFSPIGLTLLESLAQRGAHVIALSPYPVDSEQVKTYVELLRSTTSNEQIYAEQCDLASPTSIQAFCKRFMSGQEQRLDALLFTHEYRHVGALNFLSRRAAADDADARETASLATFLLTTLLLPALLTAPAERDIRIINVVNRFYAAAAGPAFSVATPPPSKSTSTFLREGARALRTVVLTRHLQRILDALPSAQVPKTDDGAVPVVSLNAQKSNIVAVTVSPGISRVETVAPLLNADWATPQSHSSPFGIVLYLLLYPLLMLFTKSSGAAIQSVLHVLFLPTPFKVLSQAAGPNKTTNAKDKAGADAEPEEVLKPGALYAECAVVRLQVKLPQAEIDADVKSAEDAEKKNAASGDAQKKKREEVLEVPDDGELGGELAGRLVWEWYEAALKVWEGAHPATMESGEGEGAAAVGESVSPAATGTS
ncbi:hypothetical protein C8R44DRAFT_759138 [Mycena epipterygia]|nr:hypothetical protein C8R44DRAFT_759138 [Mycena epipterygia]